MTTKRSSTRTIILSLVAAALFGLFVLWASVQVQIWVVTWWEKTTSSQEYKERNRKKTTPTPLATKLSLPPGNWENSPPLSESMKMIIAEVEKNEALYNQLSGIEIKSSSIYKVEQHEYSLDGEDWTSDRESLIWKGLEINPPTGSGVFGRSSFSRRESDLATTTNESIEVPELDFKKIEEVEKAIKIRARIRASQTDSHVILQDDKNWRSYSHYTYESNEVEKYHAPLKSHAELIIQRGDDSRETKRWSSNSFHSYDGFAQYTSSLNGEFYREPMAQRVAPLGTSLDNLFELYEGGSKKMKRMKDLVNENNYRYSPGNYSESTYQGEEKIEGEPVKVIVRNYYNTNGPVKLLGVQKLFLAYNKNYLPIRIEEFPAEGTEPLKVKTMSKLTELKPGLWFPTEIIEQGYSLSYGNFSRTFTAEGMSPNSEVTDRTLYKRFKTHQIVQVAPDYDQSFFSTLPGVSKSDFLFLDVAEQFVKHFQAEEEEELLKLTHPQYFEPKMLKTINDSPVKKSTLELYNYEMRILPHDLVGQEYEVAAGVIFKAYNRKFTKEAVGSLSLLLRKDEQGNWRVDSCGPNYRYGHHELLRLRTEHLYQPPVESPPSRKPAIAEKEKTEKTGSPSQ